MVSIWAGVSPSVHQAGMPFAGRPPQTVCRNAPSLGIGPSGLRDRIRWGARVVPVTSSPWHRAQLRLKYFHPWYVRPSTVSSGAVWYASRSGTATTAESSALDDGSAAGWTVSVGRLSEACARRDGVVRVQELTKRAAASRAK